ncbi:uncharacterized protein VNE69_12030 [Vairimorpha necatrix]|uniref:Uncharacterized protein n=1 Tax=Vairimorpha necatrix TaxID=6039 RepID=A0AAX4JGI0_9MICR
MFHSICVLFCSLFINKTSETGSSSIKELIQNKRPNLIFCRSKEDLHLPLKKRKTNIIEIKQHTSIINTVKPYIRKTENILSTIKCFREVSNEQSDGREQNTCTDYNKVTEQRIPEDKSADYKLLLEKLNQKILSWNLEDNKFEIKKIILNGQFTAEHKRFKKAKMGIYKKFNPFFSAIYLHFYTLKEAVQNSANYGNSHALLNDQLIFFEKSFEYLKNLLQRRLSYKYDVCKLINLYSNLPVRMKIFRDEFEIVKNFKDFILVLEVQNMNNIKIKEGLSELLKRLKRLFYNLNKMNEKNNAIIESLEKLINKQI